MDDLDGIPRGGHEPDSIRALVKMIKDLGAQIRILQRAAPQRSMSLTDGGDLTIKNGGLVRVEGGGSMEIDDGEIIVTGSTYDSLSDVVRVAQVALRTEEVTHENVGWTTRRPGIFFSTDGVEGASIHSFLGDDANTVSGIKPVTYGPMVGTDINQSSSVYLSPGNAVLSASAFYKTGADMTDSRSQCAVMTTPDSLVLQLYRQSVGEIGSIKVSMDDPKLRLYGAAGVDVSGPFTVDGEGVATTAVATAARDGLMPKVDKAKLDTAAVIATPGTLAMRNSGGQLHTASPGGPNDATPRSYVDEQVNTRAPTSHTHSTSDVTGLVTALAGKAATSHNHTTAQVNGLDTALAGKASTAVATASVAGLMPATDKSKLDTSTASATALRLIQRDSLGRAQVADPAVAADIATKGYVDAAVSTTPVPQELARGKVTIAGPVAAGGFNAGSAVTFPPGMFSGEVIMTFGTNDARISPNIVGLSASGATIRAFNYTTAATTAAPTIWWIAVQG